MMNEALGINLTVGVLWFMVAVLSWNPLMIIAMLTIVLINILCLMEEL